MSENSPVKCGIFLIGQCLRQIVSCVYAFHIPNLEFVVYTEPVQNFGINVQFKDSDKDWFFRGH